MPFFDQKIVFIFVIGNELSQLYTWLVIILSFLVYYAIQRGFILMLINNNYVSKL